MKNIIKIARYSRATSQPKDTTSVDLAALRVSSLASDIGVLPSQSATSAPVPATPLSPSFPPPSLPLAWHPSEPPSRSVSLAAEPPAVSSFAAPFSG